MAVSSGANRGNIKNGLVDRPYCEAPEANDYNQNVIRILQLNQAAYLFSYAQKKSIVLPPIPDALWFNSDAIDYNQPYCQVATVLNADPFGSNGHAPRVDRFRTGIGFAVKDKTGRPDLSADQANAYLAVFLKILESYLVARPQELVYGWTNAVAQVDRIAINSIPANGKILTIAGIPLTFSSTPTTGQINTSAGTSIEVAKSAVTQINNQISTVKAILDGDEVLVGSKTVGIPFQSTTDADLTITTPVKNVIHNDAFIPQPKILGFQSTTSVLQTNEQDRPLSKLPYLEFNFEVTHQVNFFGMQI